MHCKWSTVNIKACLACRLVARCAHFKTMTCIFDSIHSQDQGLYVLIVESPGPQPMDTFTSDTLLVQMFEDHGLIMGDTNFSDLRKPSF